MWNGVCAPKGTPIAIIDRLKKETNLALADNKIKARFAEMGAWVLPGPPADFAKLIGEEIERWAKVIRTAGIKAE